MFPKKAYLSDVNEKLINFYIDLKNDPEKLFQDVNRLIESHSDEQYYAVRDKYNNPRSTSSVYFLYLNRTCFNGIYRENRKGEFNVPVGRRKSSFSFHNERFPSIILSALKILICRTVTLGRRLKGQKKEILFTWILLY